MTKGLIEKIGKNFRKALFLFSAGMILYSCSTITPKPVNLDYRQNHPCSSDSSEIIQIRENIKKSMYDFKKPKAEDSYEYNKFFGGIYPETPENFFDIKF
jgi:hypothetical protein